MSPARREDYLFVNDMLEPHKSKDSSYFFTPELCGHRWLENGKSLKRSINIHQYLKAYESAFCISKEI